MSSSEMKSQRLETRHNFASLLTNGVLEKTKENVINNLRRLAAELDTKQRDMNIAKTSFATTGIVGTGLAIGGAIAAPFTFGASLGLTIAGASIGVASGLGGLATAIADHIVNSNALKEAEAAIAVYMDKITELLDMVSLLLYTSSPEQEDDFNLEESIEERIKLIPDEKERKNLEIFLRGLRTGIDASGQAAHLGATIGTMSANAAAAAGRTSISTLGTGLKVLRIGGVVLSVVTLPLDLHTLVTNSIKIHKHEPSMVAEQIREMARTLEQHHVLDMQEEEELVY